MTKKAPRKTPATRKSPATSTQSRRPDSEKSTSEKTLTREKQTGLYEKAMNLFHAGEFRKAKDLFESAAAGPSREMAHSARVHRMVCERRLSKGEVKLPTAEDHYNYAVTLINQRRFEPALEHLEKALAGTQNGDHVYYAMAICQGLMGDLDGAAARLEQAIRIQPRNRTAARNDADFQPIASAPQIKKVLYP